MAAEFRGVWGKLGLRLVVVSGVTELILENDFAKLVRHVFCKILQHAQLMVYIFVWIYKVTLKKIN